MSESRRNSDFRDANDQDNTPDDLDADLISDEAALAAAEAELNADPDPEAITIEGEPSAEPIAQTEPDSRYITGDLDDDQES